MRLLVQCFEGMLNWFCHYFTCLLVSWTQFQRFCWGGVWGLLTHHQAILTHQGSWGGVWGLLTHYQAILTHQGFNSVLTLTTQR